MKKTKALPPSPAPDVPDPKPETFASKTRTRTSTKQDLDDSLVRNGKIARLPAVLREALNRALARGVSGPAVLKWINDEPETQAVLRREFKARPISPQNLSEWRQGGFRDWLRKQEAREVFCEFAAHHQNLSALELNEKIALWLGARMVCMTGHLEQLDPRESWPVVRQMVRDVASLRRGDHRIREQKFKERAKDKITREEHMRWAMEPGRLDWLVRQVLEREGREAEEIREIRYALFGMLAGDDPEDMAWEAKQRGMTIEELMEFHYRRGKPPIQQLEQNAQSDAAEAGTGEDESELEAQGGQHASDEKNKYEQATARKKTRHRSNASASTQKTIRGGTETAVVQGNTKEIKPNQTESNRNSADGQAPPAAETPNTKNQTPIKMRADGPTKLVSAVGSVGSAGHTEQAPATAVPGANPANTPAGPAPKPLTGPGITFPRRPQHYIDICCCGARNQIPLSECKVCQKRILHSMPPCNCH